MFSPDSITKQQEKIIRKTLLDIGETEKNREQTLRLLNEWIQWQPHLISLATVDQILLNFARACKYRNELIKQKIDTYMSMRTAIPEFFSGLDPYNPVSQKTLQLGGYLPLLEYDELCRKVIIMRPGSYNPFEHRPVDVERANFMTADVMALLDRNVFITGIVLIIDMEGFNMAHMNQRSLPLMKKYMRYITEAIPIRLQGLHFIQLTPALSTFYNIITGCSSKKIRKRFKVHSDLSSLHKDFSKNILPIEYGGDGPSISALTDYWKEKVEENQKYLIMFEKASQSDESKRPGKPKRSEELFGIEGSFRKLEID